MAKEKRTQPNNDDGFEAVNSIPDVIVDPEPVNYQPSYNSNVPTMEWLDDSQSQKAARAALKKAPKNRPKIRAGKWVAAVLCCVPVILELLAVLLIPKIGVLANNAYVSRWGWQARSVPLKISFICVIILGFAIQMLGLVGQLPNVLGMFTQIISFALFVLSSYAAHNNSSVYALWGLAVIVPVSLLVTALRYTTADGFGFIDDFNFWYYLPIALEVAEYILFFLVFAPLFGASASLWFFVAITVTTVASIAVSSFWEDFHWAPVGINLGVAVLLCVIFWIGRLVSSEWFSNGGVITVVILAIGGSWFIHWFIHRNDP